MLYWTLSPIYFNPTGTLLSRRSIPSFSSSRPQLKGNKDRTKRFYNNVNSKTLKSIEGIAKGVALIQIS